MKISEYFNNENYCGSLAEYIKVIKNNTEIYHGRIMTLLSNNEIANYALIDEPIFENGIGYIAYVK